MPHAKRAVSLVIVDGHLNLPWGFVWVCMGLHIYFITPAGGVVVGRPSM